MNNQIKEMYRLIIDFIEDNCYSVDEGRKHAICKECGEVTGAGAIYRHKKGCRIEKLTDLLYLGL
jgi:hypothetical protein